MCVCVGGGGRFLGQEFKFTMAASLLSIYSHSATLEVTKFSIHDIILSSIFQISVLQTRL